MTRGNFHVYLLALLTPAVASAQSVELTIKSEPPAAQVFLRRATPAAPGSEQPGDRFLGVTPEGGQPLELELEAGAAEVVVAKRGYIHRVETVRLRPGGAARLEVRLTKDVTIPRRVNLKSLSRFVSSPEEAEKLFLHALSQVLLLYVEEPDVRKLYDGSVSVAVEILDSLRQRELLLRRELSPAARQRYYADELDLRRYPPLTFTRLKRESRTDPSRGYRLAMGRGEGAVGIEGATDDGDTDSFREMWRRTYRFLAEEWDREGMLSDSILAYCLIEGMLEALDDDHTDFLDPRDVADMQVQTKGSLVGIGVLVAARGRVVFVVPEGPAAKAGLLKDDRIVAVDGVEVDGLETSDVVKHLKGKINSPVEVTVLRSGERVMVRVLRDRVRVRTVARRYFAERKVGYVRVSSFMDESLAEQFAREVGALERQGAESLVIDLRHNTGGLLTQAVAMADLFVSQGTIVSTRARPGLVPESVKTARPETTRWGKLPLAVLIDGRSASAAEILAGTLQEHGRAVLIGEKSYGKGSVQRVIPLAAGGRGQRCSLALTVATYHLPSGKTPDKQGVRPDRAVALSPAERALIASRSNYELEDEPVDAQLAEALAALSPSR